MPKKSKKSIVAPVAPVAPAPVAPAPALPVPVAPELPVAPAADAAATPIVSKSGKVIGTLYKFGVLTARELREEGKAAGMRGDALTEYVNAALKGEAEARNLLASAKVQKAFNDGAIADTFRDTKGGIVLRAVKPKAVKAKGPSVDEKLEAAKLEVAALREQLNALLAAAAQK